MRIIDWSSDVCSSDLLEKAPGVFSAAVAGAPVTKCELYDTHYTERYLGQPPEKPSAYPGSGAVDEAVTIKDPLLLVHGMSDDRVGFDNSTALTTQRSEEHTADPPSLLRTSSASSCVKNKT